jgi:mono/diheme cytochrome c family protein
MSRRARLVVVPAILLVGVTAGVFLLAELHLAKDEGASAPSGAVVAGDAARGETLFAENCASCHGEAGAGGGVGPTLAGSGVATEDAQATIEDGSGIMPGDLVSGQDLSDVLAYIETINR